MKPINQPGVSQLGSGWVHSSKQEEDKATIILETSHTDRQPPSRKQVLCHNLVWKIMPGTPTWFKNVKRGAMAGQPASHGKTDLVLALSPTSYRTLVNSLRLFGFLFHLSPKDHFCVHVLCITFAAFDCLPSSVGFSDLVFSGSPTLLTTLPCLFH
jgi:hypothetical protein